MNTYFLNKEDSLSSHICTFDKTEKHIKPKFLIHKADVGDCIEIFPRKEQKQYVPKRWYVINHKNEIIPEGLGTNWFSTQTIPIEFSTLKYCEERLLWECRDLIARSYCNFGSLIKGIRLLSCLDVNEKVYCNLEQENFTIQNLAVQLACTHNEDVSLVERYPLQANIGGHIRGFEFSRTSPYPQALLNVCPVITLDEKAKVYRGNGSIKKPYVIEMGEAEEYYKEWKVCKNF